MIYKTFSLLAIVCIARCASQDEGTTQTLTLGSVTTETICSIGSKDCSESSSETSTEPLSSTVVPTTEPLSVATTESAVNTTTTVSPLTSNGTSTAKPATTKSPNASLSTSPPANTIKGSPPPQSVFRKMDRDMELAEGSACTCDLTVGECEINCCCDPDCEKHQVAVFSKCLPRPRTLFDDRMCHSMKVAVMNNTEQLVEENRAGAFCILRTNLAAWVVYPTRPAVLSQTQFVRTWSRTHAPSWPQVGAPPTLFTEQKLYVRDSVLWRFHPKEIRSYDIPTPLATSACSSNRPLRFLRSWSKSCLQTTPENEFECGQQNADFFVQRLNIIRNPTLVNRTQLALNKPASCPKELCAPVSTFICSGKESFQQNVSSCSNVSKKALSSFNKKNNMCHNVVKGLRLILYHNGTEGITSISVYLSLANISATHRGILQREYSVDFKWISSNSSSNKSIHRNLSNSTNLTRRSGHPGYLVGKPVLAGYRQKREEPTTGAVDSGKKGSYNQLHEKVVLDYSPKERFSVHGPGQCYKANENRFPILFGEDMHVSCGLPLLKSNFSSVQSCNDLRVQIFRLLLGETKARQLLNASTIDAWGVMVGTFGDADPNDLSDWVPLLIGGMPDTPAELSRAQNRSASEAASPLETLRCDNIVTAMEVRVLHSFVGSVMNPQSKIIGASVRFESSRDLLWNCDSDVYGCERQLILTTSVKFVDLSSSVVARYAEPPGIHIRLPPDFFYPFSVAGSSSLVGSRPRMDISALMCFSVICAWAVFKRLLY